MAYKLSNRSLDNIYGIKAVLIAIIVEALLDSDCPYDFGIPQFGGKREAAEQNSLFHAGLSYKDGYIDKSKHQTGDAFDIFAYVNGRATWDIEILTKLARHIMMIAVVRYGIQLTWGGDWDGDTIRVDKDKDESFLDGGHFQMV